MTDAELSIDGYDVHSVNLNERNGRGIVIYTLKDITVTPLEPETQFEESLWLEIKVNPKEKILVECVYRSDSIMR